MGLSTLELQWRVRIGGGGRTQRRYRDFVVDGASLLDRLGATDERVSVLGCWPDDSQRDAVQQLLSAPGRVPLYVCAECGDLSCGAITALIERRSDGFVWRDFAFENSDQAVTALDSYPNVGPFLFNKTQYWQVINERMFRRFSSRSSNV